MPIENWIWVGLIPLFPLLLSVFYGLAKGLFRWELSRKWVSASLIVTLLASFLFSFLSLLDLVGEPDGTALIDRIANWIGVGVGASAFVGGVALRFDPLSAVFALLVSGVGFLAALYSVIHMDSPSKEERSFDRFFGLFIFQVFAMLALVLADNLLILLFGFAALVASTQFLIGFVYSDPVQTRGATWAGTVGWIGFGGLLFSVMMVFRGLSEMGRPGLTLSQLEASLPALAVATVDLPTWLGGAGVPLPELLAVGVALAACSLASLWPFLCWLPQGSKGPVPASILIQTVTTLAAAGYLLARFSPWLSLAEVTSETLAWLGAIGAFVAAGIACTRFEITRVMAWSSVSQFGLVLLAVGVGGYTEAVFHVIAHAFA
ncbi:MAG: proton-conducting transporter membrane subunit, partial [Myxococcota bacterium]|nr:proton-conducting transporter membrane subunit [Myxococcota bacterium]